MSDERDPSPAGGLGGLLAGTHTLMVGMELEPSGGARIYLDHRMRGLYAFIRGEDQIERARRAWSHRGQHVTVPIPPPECVFSEEDDHDHSIELLAGIPAKGGRGRGRGRVGLISWLDLERGEREVIR